MTAIKTLFDYQRFENNPHLARLISESESRVEGRRELDEGTLEVWAAGDPTSRPDPRLNPRRKKDDD